MRLVTVLGTAVLLSGCASNEQLRQKLEARARFDLECQYLRIVALEETGSGFITSYGVQGCGRRVTYVLGAKGTWVMNVSNGNAVSNQDLDSSPSNPSYVPPPTLPLLPNRRGCSTPLKIFLDDLRDCPDGWTLVQTAPAAIAALETNAVTHLSLDHDLGDDDVAGTGYDVVVWIEEAVATRGFVPPAITLHTANAVGRQKMEAAVKSIQRLMDRR